MPGPPQAELAVEGTAQSLYPPNAGAECFLQQRTRLRLISHRTSHLMMRKSFVLTESRAGRILYSALGSFGSRPGRSFVHGARTNCGLPPRSVQTLNKDSSIESPCPIDRPGACTLPRRCGCSASRSRRFFVAPRLELARSLRPRAAPALAMFTSSAVTPRMLKRSKGRTRGTLASRYIPCVRQVTLR